MDKVKAIQQALLEPFKESDIEWRIQSAGEKNNKSWARVLAYITARAVMDRLDNVFGIDGWKDEYAQAPDGGVLCKLSVRIEGEWITKEDVSENTNVDPVKGGVSGALKRAAVKYGIGRYLYNLTDNFALVAEQGVFYQPANPKKGTKAFKWNPPVLPDWALPMPDDYAEKLTVLEEYLEAYNESKNKEAAKYVKDALNDGSYSKLVHAIETIERKRGQ